jgi:hypothetical protein
MRFGYLTQPEVRFLRGSVAVIPTSASPLLTEVSNSRLEPR